MSIEKLGTSAIDSKISPSPNHLVSGTVACPVATSAAVASVE